MFTSSTALVITSIFALVIVFLLSNIALEKGIDLIKRMRD